MLLAFKRRSRWFNVMNDALKSLINQTCSVYLDDIIIVYGKTPEEHNKKPRVLFQWLKKISLTLQLDKCEYLRPEVTILGMSYQKAA